MKVVLPMKALLLMKVVESLGRNGTRKRIKRGRKHLNKG